jgi:hypothetical protein
MVEFGCFLENVNILKIKRVYDICLNVFHNDIFSIAQPLKNMRLMQLLQMEVCRKILKGVWGET